MSHTHPSSNSHTSDPLSSENPFETRENQHEGTTNKVIVSRSKSTFGQNTFYGFTTIQEGLMLSKKHGLIFLCWVLFFTMPILVIRDFYMTSEAAGASNTRFINGIRVALLIGSFSLLIISKCRPKTQFKSFFEPTFFLLCILMVTFTVVNKGGPESPIYAGFLTVLVGWGYFFSVPASTMALLSAIVIMGYVGILAWRTNPTINQWEQVFVQCSYLLVGFSCAAYAATVHRLTQIKRFESILTSHNLAGLDPLTSVMNRSSLSKRIISAGAEHARYNQSVSCLLIDVDGLNKINQKYGESTGDEVLIHVSNLISGHIGSQGEVGRWEADIFAVILNATDRRTALIHAERIRAATERSCFKSKGEEIPLTVSIGVGSEQSLHENKDKVSILQRAERALARTRSHGTNRVGSSHIGITSETPQPKEELSRILSMPDLKPEKYARWLQKLSRSGFRRMTYMLTAILIATWLIENISSQNKTEKDQLTSLALRASIIVTVVGTFWLSRSNVRAYLSIIPLQYFCLLLAATGISALSIINESQSGPGFISIMILMLVGSCTTPGGLRYGLPTFVAIFLMWPLMTISTGHYELADLLIRCSVILVMAITCTLCHHHLHRTALQQAQLRHHLNGLSLSDGLTGAWNRRGFDARLIHLCDTSNRSKGFLSLALIELPEFDQIKNTHGHEMASVALKHFADIVHRVIRSPDVFARLDTNKFALITPQTSSSGVISLVSRIKNKLEDLPYVSDSREIIPLDAIVGISEHKGCPINPKIAARALIDHAEAAIFSARAKHSKSSSSSYSTSPMHGARARTKVLVPKRLEITQS